MKQVPSGKGRKPHKKTERTNWVENESEGSDSDLPVHKTGSVNTSNLSEIENSNETSSYGS